MDILCYMATNYFNADNKKLKVKHMYSTGDNVVQLKKAGNNEQ